MVGLSCTAGHNVPDWRRFELRRAIVHIEYIRLIAIQTAENFSLVVGETNGRLILMAVAEATDTADIDLESVASETVMRV